MRYNSSNAIPRRNGAVGVAVTYVALTPQGLVQGHWHRGQPQNGDELSSWELEAHLEAVKRTYLYMRTQPHQERKAWRVVSFPDVSQARSREASTAG
jgi:hypothetical protein